MTPVYLAEALRAYVEWCGGVHDDGCPEDDTCSCSSKWINDGVNEAVRVLAALPAAGQSPDLVREVAECHTVMQSMWALLNPEEHPDICAELALLDEERGTHHGCTSALASHETTPQKHWTEGFCTHCGGNDVVKLPSGVSICDHCGGRCYEPEVAASAPPSDISRLRQAISPRHAEDWSIDDLINLAHAHRDDSESIDRHSRDDSYGQTTDWDAVTWEQRTLLNVSRLPEYVQHKPGCRVSRGLADQGCNCGLADTLAALSFILKHL